MPEQTPLQLLQSSFLFQDLPEALLKRAASHLVLRYHPAGELLLIEKDWGNSVYLILTGWVKIRTYNRDGREITLNILGPGNSFGEMASLAAVPRSSDVVSLTAVSVGCVPAADFMTLVQEEATLGYRLAQLMVRRIRQLNRRLQVRELESTARLADVLLFLAEGQGRSSGQGMRIPNLPHRELGNLCGLTRETVTRALKKLEQEKLLERPDSESIILTDPHALETLTEV